MSEIISSSGVVGYLCSKSQGFTEPVQVKILDISALDTVKIISIDDWEDACCEAGKTRLLRESRANIYTRNIKLPNVGEKFYIGGVSFLVVQNAQPPSTVCRHLKSALKKSGRAGIYARPIIPGTITLGDEVKIATVVYTPH